MTHPATEGQALRNVYHRVINRVANGADVLFRSARRRTTTQGLTIEMPSAADQNEADKQSSGTALRTGASQGAPIDAIRKYATARMR